MKNVSVLFSLLLLLIACKKDQDLSTPPVVEKDKIFEKIWSTRIYDAPVENVGSDNAYVYKDWYIVTGDHWSHPDPSLYAYDTKTGKLAWKWTQSGKYQIPGLNLVGKDNILIMSDSKGILAFDIETRQLLWEVVHDDPVHYLGYVGQLPIYGDYVYKVLNFDNFYGPEILVRYNIHTGEKQTLHTFQLLPNGMSPNMSPPAMWVDPESNDTILVMVNQIQRVDLGPDKSPTDLVAYNMTKKQIQWTLKEYTPWGSNGLYPPAVFKNTVMMAGDWSIYGVDMYTGKVKWRTQFKNLPWVGNFTTTQHLVVANRLYVNPAADDVMCINAENGAVIWHNKHAAANCSPKMLYNNDMLIIGSFGDGSVVIMDGFTGKVLHSERGERTYYTDVLYDKTTDKYFVQDFAQAVGFKINKPE